MINMQQIYCRKQFGIYKGNSSYVVVNHNIDGFAHTHINNLSTAIWIVDLELKRKLPHDMCKYLLQSLLRISDDMIYSQKITNLINNKKGKEKYINRSR